MMIIRRLMFVKQFLHQFYSFPHNRRISGRIGFSGGRRAAGKKDLGEKDCGEKTAGGPRNTGPCSDRLRHRDERN